MTATQTQPEVILYATDTCPWCDRAKDYLSSKNVPFVVKNVQHDHAAATEMMRLTGQQGVPVVKAGDDVVLGYDEAGLGRIAKRYSGPKRPPLGLMAADAESYLKRHPEIAEKYPEGTKGVFVGDVKRGSVAEKSGVRRGDVIQAVANKRVRRMTDLDSIIDTLDAGGKVSLRYLRDGEEANTTFQF